MSLLIRSTLAFGDSEICFEASEGGDKASRGGLSLGDVTDEYGRDNEENDEEIDEEEQTDQTSGEEVVCKEREARLSSRQSRTSIELDDTPLHLLLHVYVCFFMQV